MPATLREPDDVSGTREGHGGNPIQHDQAPRHAYLDSRLQQEMQRQGDTTDHQCRDHGDIHRPIEPAIEAAQAATIRLSPTGGTALQRALA